MSLRLRSIEVENFRKFRKPLSITGLTDGLNIIIEPNEAGKSTLLEALRAAFFVRHGTKNQLAVSFAPHGESVAPRVHVDFDIGDTSWSVAKQFLKNASIEVRGPTGRTDGDEAEALLQRLLGFERDKSRGGGDTASYGTLGLLWVGQADALAVPTPGEIVRDTVLSTLEAEVGTIMGGATYDRVRARVETQYDSYWTKTGRSGGRQTLSTERLEAARAAHGAAQLRLATLEQTFNELELARGRLKVLEREMADQTDAETRAKLVNDVDIARAAAQILATRTAEKSSLTTRLQSLQDLQERHDNASKALVVGETALTKARNDRATLAAELREAKDRHDQARERTTKAREARQVANDAQKAGEALMGLHRRRRAIDAARERHARLTALEQKHTEATGLSRSAIPAETIKELEALERAVTAANVAVTIGATRIELTGPSNGITINGDAFAPGERVITGETRITLPSAAELIVRPPVSASSAAAQLHDALQKQRQALQELGLSDLTGARSRNDAAKAASSEMRTIEAQIAAATPADPELDLAAGAGALKLFIAQLITDPDDDADLLIPDIDQLSRVVAQAESDLSKAEGATQSALDALRSVEAKDAPLAGAEVGAQRDVDNAKAQLNEIRQNAEFAELETSLTNARAELAGAAVKLEEATRDAAVHNEADINRRIAVIDARTRATLEARRSLETQIARLEATVEIEGGKGLADQAAAAGEEMEAATAALDRVSHEAETLKMLRSALDEARLETSRSFLGPVARRAKRHIERILPGCDLTFSDSLSLQTVIRGGVSEGCDNLSKGTQEQLSVLTRLAFADMLLEQGRPVSLILDDPLVYSDDGRLDVLTEILTEAAERMQVILLTCRERAFRHVPGNRVLISDGIELAA